MWNLQPCEVHVWISPLGPVVAVPDAVSSLLSADERERAQRYRSPTDAARFALHRAVLRVMLGNYVQGDPRALRFSYGTYGKPQLQPDPATPPIRFNLAHCESLAVYAFARSRDLGVDVERDRPLTDLERLIQHVLSPREQAALAGLSGADRQLAFWRCWTQKEAFSKTVGRGLSMPMTSLEVVARPGLPAGIVSIAGSSDDARAWHCHELSISGHVAMLAMQGKDVHLVVRTFDEELARGFELLPG